MTKKQAPLDNKLLEAVLRKLATGDLQLRNEGFDELYDMVHDRFLGFFHRRCPGEAEDLLQATMTKLLTTSAPESMSSASGWVWSVARSVLSDHLRKLGSDAAAAWPDDEEMAPEPVDVPGYWDAWRGKGQEPPGPDIERWSEGQRRLALEHCMDEHMKLFAKDHPNRADVLGKSALERWATRAVAKYIGRNEKATETYLRESRKKGTSYFEYCRQFLEAQGVPRKGKPK